MMYCSILLLSFTMVVVVESEIQYVDMSHEYIENTTYFWFKRNYLKRYPNPIMGQYDDYWLADFAFYMGEHGGTHIDAPYHFCKTCRTIEQIPLSELLNLPLVKLDVTHKTKDNADYGVQIQDFKEWEAQYGQIPPGSAVFIDVGWEQYYPDRKTFLGTDVENHTLYHFPGFEPETVTWLADERKVRGIGTNAASFDRGQNLNFEAHTAFLTKDLWGAEVVANLKKVPAVGARVSVLPTKFKGGSGAPSRIFAMWDPASSADRPSVGGMVFILAATLRMLIYGC